VNLSPPPCLPEYARHHVKFLRLAWLNAASVLRSDLNPVVRRIQRLTAGMEAALNKTLSPPETITSYDVCPFQRAPRRT